jgi:hypothetical protein
MADLKAEASSLLEDFSKNFIEPLHKELSGGQVTLSDRIKAPKLFDGRDNPYAEWPDFKQVNVPAKFHPAPNEKLLIDVSEYPAEFDSLVESTVNDSKLDAKRVVIDQLIMGVYGSDELKSLPKESQWSIVSQIQPWVPNDRSHQLRESAPQPARFLFLSDHMGYLDRARLWLEIPGRAFSAYLDQTISTFLSDQGDRAEQARNRTKFVQEFTAAVASANPLVELNQSLLGQVHGSDGGKISALFSPIPVDVSDELFGPLKEALVNLNFWDDSSSKKWFVGPGEGAKKRTVDIFTQIKIPVQPIVMGSVMGPIAETWSRFNSKKDTRFGFMKWRRGRTLPEAIPAHAEVWTQMLKGWYVMRLLNMFEQAPRDESYEEKGPKLSVWVNSNTKYTPFPYPLYYPGIAPIDDLAGIVLQSLTIAMVNCYEQTSLAPLDAYKRLGKLGDADSEFSELAEWVRNGTSLQSGAPLPLAERAGSSDQSFEERQSRCVTWLSQELAKFQANVAAVEANDDFRSYPVTWEIRAEVIEALSELISSISSIKPPVSL